MLDDFSREIQQASTRVESQQESYSSFISWLQEAQEEWEEFTSAEKEAFRRAFSEHRQYTTELIEPEELPKIRSQIEQAFTQPLIEAIKEAIHDIIDVFGLEIGPSQVATISAELDENMNKSQLIEIRQKYDQLSNKIQNRPDPIITVLSSELDEDRSLLLSPGTISSKLVEYNNRYEQLLNVSSCFSEYDVDTELESSEIGYFGAEWLNHPAPDPEAVDHYLQQIHVVLNNIKDNHIPGETAINSAVAESFESPDQDLTGHLQDLSDSLESLHPHIERVGQIRKITESKISGGFAQVDTAELNNVLGTISDDEFEDYRSLKSALEKAEDRFQSWSEHVISRWQINRQIARVLTSELEFDEPDTIDLSLNFEELLDSNAPEAMQKLDDLQHYIRDKRSELEKEFGNEPVELLMKLIQEDEILVDLTSPEAIKVLNEKISLKVAIDED